MSQERSEIRGPLRIWPFPILNFIMRIFSRGFANLEEWEIVEDSQGNLKKIIVHRTARRD